MRLLPLLVCCAAACTGTEGDLLVRGVPDLGGPAQGLPDGGFACTTGSQSGTCLAETAWESAANTGCLVAGLALQSYLVSPLCADGMTYQGVAYVCCPAEIVMGCVKETLGDPLALMCQDAAAWKLTASQSCQASGFVLDSLSLLEPGGTCGPMGYGEASYVCCPKG